MAPPKVADYVKQSFKNSNAVKVEVIDNQDTIKKDYPFTHAVNRGSNGTKNVKHIFILFFVSYNTKDFLVVPRYQARIVKLTYEGEGPIEETLMFVGKVTQNSVGRIKIFAYFNCSGCYT